MATSFLSVTRHREAFHELVVHGVEGLILVGALFLLDGERRREGKKKRKEGRKKSPWGRRVSPGLDPPCWLCSRSQLLGAICGSVFEVFPPPSVTAAIILAKSSQSYPSVAPTSQGGFGVTEHSLSASVP
jgi:hypothetical protein